MSGEKYPGDTLKRSYVLYVLTVFLVVSFSAMSGCLDTPVAPTAAIDENALESYGWSQVGAAEHKTVEQNISNSTSISIENLVVKYRNDRLERNIEAQINDSKKQYKLPEAVQVPYITSEIRVNRITLPAGLKLPGDIIGRIVENSAGDLSSENNVKNLRSTGTRQITLKNGLVVPVHTYEGSIGSGDGLSVIGVIVAYEDESSNTIVTGIVPNGSMSVSIGPVNSTLFTIDGEKELEEMLELIASIE